MSLSLGNTERRADPMTTTRVLGIAAVILAVLVQTACSYNYARSFIRPTYRPSLFNYAAAGRDLRVDTQGNPFAASIDQQADFGTVVTALMQDRNWGARTNFTASPGESARPQYRVVVVFDPVEPAPYSALCNGTVRTGPTEGRIRVRAAFCETVSSGPRVLTGVRGNLVPEATVESPEFAALMAGVTRDLFPIWDADFDDDDCPSFVIFCH
ncbi:MAG: hypothetical protein V3R98_10835 [Alphaproteobacteria bacterium]